MVEQITQLFAIEALILTSLVATSFTGAEREREVPLYSTAACKAREDKGEAAAVCLYAMRSKQSVGF